MPNYSKKNSAWFCMKNDPRWELSNLSGSLPLFWPPERSAANLWRSSEHLYQASKYGTDVRCLPADSPNANPGVRQRIRAQVGSRGAKMTQKCAVKAGLVRPDWKAPHDVRLKVMVWVLELKLYWNRSTFGRVLEQTGTLPIVEISSKDDFWGCYEQPDGTLVGENHLGQLLVRVRERLPAILRRDFTYPEGFLLP